LSQRPFSSPCRCTPFVSLLASTVATCLHCLRETPHRVHALANSRLTDPCAPRLPPRPTTATLPMAVRPTSRPSRSRASPAPSAPRTASLLPALPMYRLAPPLPPSALSRALPATRSALSSALLRPTGLPSVLAMPSAALPPASRSRVLVSAPTGVLALRLLALRLLALRLLVLLRALPLASATSLPALPALRALKSASAPARVGLRHVLRVSRATLATVALASRSSSRSSPSPALRPTPRCRSSCSSCKAAMSIKKLN